MEEILNTTNTIRALKNEIQKTQSMIEYLKNVDTVEFAQIKIEDTDAREERIREFFNLDEDILIQALELHELRTSEKLHRTRQKLIELAESI